MIVQERINPAHVMPVDIISFELYHNPVRKKL